MLKQGTYRALRNLPIGWVLQAIHSTDRSERRARLLLEAALLIAGVMALRATAADELGFLAQCAVAFAVVHTLMWLLVGNFWVYMLDSFKFVRNPGIDAVIRFVEKTRDVYANDKIADAVLIYGSACRSMFHGRSDLDLRVVCRRDGAGRWAAVTKGLLLKVWSFFIRMPVDLQVVDSFEFLDRQMRADEQPIVVFLRDGVHRQGLGVDFAEVREDPAMIMKGSAAKSVAGNAGEPRSRQTS